MLTSGDLVDLDLGVPAGREAGFVHPAVIITAQRVLARTPSVVHVVPLTSTIRPFEAEVRIEPDASNRLDGASAAQCQHLRAVAPTRIVAVRGNVGPLVLRQIRETVAVLIDLPA
jgi:mRNA interferase MazF